MLLSRLIASEAGVFGENCPKGLLAVGQCALDLAGEEGLSLEETARSHFALTAADAPAACRQAARKALSERGPHKKGKRSKASAGKSSGKGKNKRMPATYKVKNGDTLWDIARTYGTSVSAIQAANGGNLKNLSPGKTIRMPKR
jgi:LysM repeat protein